MGSILTFRIGIPFGEKSAGFCKSMWLPGSMLNVRMGSVPSIGPCFPPPFPTPRLGVVMLHLPGEIFRGIFKSFFVNFMSRFSVFFPHSFEVLVSFTRSILVNFSQFQTNQVTQDKNAGAFFRQEGGAKQHPITLSALFIR